MITPVVEGSVSKWPYVYDSLKLHSTSLETVLFNIRCFSQCNVCICVRVYIWIMFLRCVWYLMDASTWNNFSKKEKIISDNWFWLYCFYFWVWFVLFLWGFFVVGVFVLFFFPFVIRLQRYLVCEWHQWYSGSLWTIQCCADVHTRSFSTIFK